MLTIVGARPDLPADLSPHITVVGTLDKKVSRDAEEFQRLYLQSDFFIMTSQADSSPIVYCEAMAHGLPSLATRTGGVASIVRAGENGELFDWSSNTAEQIAASVVSYRQDLTRYAKLCQDSRRLYESVYNWQTASARFNDLLLQTVV